MSFFNFQYLKQNLKKSRVTLAFVLLILPILNVILLCMRAGNRVSVLNVSDIFSLANVGMFILPVVLSILLFSFVFRKKSIDFMGSMPIDRKTIFITNTVGGIFIIFALLLVTTLFMGIAAFLFPTIYIPFGVLVDYFLIYFVNYIFVFTIANLAMSVSGNIPTMIVVSLLIMFFVPFHHCLYQTSNDYTHYNFEYDCPDCEKKLIENKETCEKDSCKNKNGYYSMSIYSKEEPVMHYSEPSQALFRFLGAPVDENMYSSSALLVAGLLSILYILLGCVLFIRRKMEVCETSFQNFFTHQFVKAFTLFTILSFGCALLQQESSFAAWLFFIALVLIYNFVYDLITKRSITKICQSLFWFLGIFVISLLYSYNFLYENWDSEPVSIKFNDNDVEHLSISAFNSDLGAEENWIEIKDRSLKKAILYGSVDRNLTGEFDNYDIKLEINGEIYYGISHLSLPVSEQVENVLLSSSDDEKDSPKDTIKNAEIITINDDYIALDKEGRDLLLETFDEENSKITFDLTTYTYQNHEMKQQNFESSSIKFQNYLFKKYKEKLEKIRKNSIYNIDFEQLKGNTIGGATYQVDEYTGLDSVLDLILKQEKLDLDKNIYLVTVYTNNGTFYYYTNITDTMLSYLRRVDVYGG